MEQGPGFKDLAEEAWTGFGCSTQHARLMPALTLERAQALKEQMVSHQACGVVRLSHPHFVPCGLYLALLGAAGGEWGQNVV